MALGRSGKIRSMLARRFRQTFRRAWQIPHHVTCQDLILWLSQKPSAGLPQRSTYQAVQEERQKYIDSHGLNMPFTIDCELPMSFHRCAYRPTKHQAVEISSQLQSFQAPLLPVRFIIITFHLLPILHLRTSLILGATGCSTRSSAHKIVTRIAVGLTVLILRAA